MRRSFVRLLISTTVAIASLIISSHASGQTGATRPSAVSDPSLKQKPTPAGASDQAPGANATSGNQAPSAPQSPPSTQPEANAPKVPAANTSTSTATGSNAAAESFRSPDLLIWLRQENRVFWGIMFFTFGAFGGLITAAFSLGESLPGIGGASVIEPDQAKASALEDAISKRQSALEQLQERITASAGNCDNIKFVAEQQGKQIKDLQSELTLIQNRISKNRWSTWKIGMPIYVLVGGATSLLLAKDVLQAIVFGATWTSVVAAIGLKNSAGQKQDAARDNAKNLASSLEQVARENSALKDTNARLDSEKQKMAELASSALKRLESVQPPVQPNV
jgi:hypothetical protein